MLPPVPPEPRSGFTLIELLVVIAILAILAGAAIPYVQTYVQESRISKAKADLEEIGKAIGLYETREKTYLASDVTQLTGRYLNGSPFDPWGRQYLVATGAGVAYSCGPDRLPNTADDLTYAYLPPLSLAQVKWIDANHTGSVDAHNTPDYLILYFSRPVASNSLLLTTPAGAHAYFSLSGITTLNTTFDWPTATSSPDGRQFMLWLANGVANAFSPGSDTITVLDNNEIWDKSTPRRRCLSRQDVVIAPQ